MPYNLVTLLTPFCNSAAFCAVTFQSLCGQKLLALGKGSVSYLSERGDGESSACDAVSVEGGSVENPQCGTEVCLQAGQQAVPDVFFGVQGQLHLKRAVVEEVETCTECEDQHAELVCLTCDEPFCRPCWGSLHR